MKTKLLSILAVLFMANNTFSQCSISGLEPVYCPYYQDVVMTGYPAGGTFSGDGVSVDHFYPEYAGIGTHTISYTVPIIVDQTGAYSPEVLTSPTYVSMGDNDKTPLIPIGFPLVIAGYPYNDFYLSSNGYVGFGWPFSDGCCSGQAIPYLTGDPSTFIAFAWEDLDPSLGGTIAYQLIGSAPNRKLVIEYNSIQHAGGGNPVIAQIHLYEGQGLVEIHTAQMNSDGGTHTMGLNMNPIFGVVPGRNATNWSAFNDYVAFILDCTTTFDVTVAQDVTPPTIICPADTTLYLTPYDLCWADGPSAPACGVNIHSTEILQAGNNIEGGHASNTLFPAVNADDFVVPAGECWKIGELTANFIHQGLTPAPNFTINIYADNGGAPGTILHSIPNQYANRVDLGNYNPSLIDSRFSFFLGNPVSLCEGTYWISFQVVNPSAANDFYWEYNTSSNIGFNSHQSSSSSGPWTQYPSDYVFSLVNYIPTITDNCFTCGQFGGSEFTVSATGPTYSYPTGVNQTTVTVTDAYGNTNSCTYHVTVIDTIAPVPMEQTLDDIVSECPLDNIPFPMAVECGGFWNVLTTPDVYPPYQTSTTITWTHSDYHGNSVTQTQNIIINDVTAPVPDISSLPDIHAECEVTSIPTPVATDNCNGAITGVADILPPFISQGTVMITWTYTDDKGNSSTQTQNVIIEDVSAPVPDLTVLPDLDGECEVTTVPVAVATDNCQGQITGIPDLLPPFANQGTTVITWTFTDQYGNTSTQTQNVVIEDVTGPNPNVNTLPNIVATCEVASLPQPSATDNCGGSVEVFNNAVLPINDLGFTTVTWLYIDQYGNITAQNQSIEILPLDLPILDYNGSMFSIQNPSLNVSYQWINCDNGNQPIVGETDLTFVPLTENNYAVVATIANCSVTSDCLFAPGAGVNELESAEVKLFPNPASSELNIETISDGTINIYDVSGKLVLSQNVNEGLSVLNVSSLSNGSYTLRFSGDYQAGNKRLIIDRN